MNEVVKIVQNDYRKFREQTNFSIIDIGKKLNYLAEKGVVWVLKGMKDLSQPEEFLIESYLSIYRANQIYDHLEENLNFKTSYEQPIVYPLQTIHSSKPVQEFKTKTQYLEVKDVKSFIGYQKAKELEEKIYELCQSFPSFEKHHIVNQIERSSKSIKERIAMGEQRYIGEKFYQYSLSIGSAKETSAWLQISLGQKYISQSQYDDLDNLANQVVSILTKTLYHLRNNKGKGMNLPKPFTPNIKKFVAYQNALLLVEKIYEITRLREFWQEKGLQYDMRKNATSCAANIAEAHQLYTPVKFKFFNNSLVALNALDGSLETALSKMIISKDSLNEIIRLRKSIRNILLKIMGNLSSQKAG